MRRFWSGAVDTFALNMGGLAIGGVGLHNCGDVEGDASDVTHQIFYHLHWYLYPITYALEVLVDFACLEAASIDVAYMTELDPFWHDDEKRAILNPEGILFVGPIAQAACAGDCVASTAGLPLDSLFWCQGCQGSLYPFTGTVSGHMGGVQASLLEIGRLIAKLHREGLLWITSGAKALCHKYPSPLIKKSQYRFQMTYPLSSNHCDPPGRTEVPWSGGLEFPYRGSDFRYLIWRKRDCCLL